MRIADAIGAAIVNGTGEGQPVGILSGVTWNSRNRIQATTLTADNLLAAIALLPAGYAARAKFAMSTATLFGNFKYYGVNIPRVVAVEVSRESGFTFSLIDYRALYITDGKPIVPGAFVKVEVKAS